MTHDAFLQAILEAPEDDTPRLIYADWLMEQEVRMRFDSPSPFREFEERVFVGIWQTQYNPQ